MKSQVYKNISLIMIIILSITLCGSEISVKNVQARPVKLSARSKNIKVGKSFNIKIKNAKSKIRVTVSKKKIVKIKKIKKNKYKITGRKIGKTTITFRVRKKKYRCRVTVKKKQTVTQPVPMQTTNQNQEEAKHIHRYKKIEVKEPVCGTDGYIVYQCECGQKKREMLNATEKHRVSPWVIDKAATFIETGSKHRECILCYVVIEIMEIPKLPNKSLENGGNLTDGNDEQIDVEDAFN